MTASGTDSATIGPAARPARRPATRRPRRPKRAFTPLPPPKTLHDVMVHLMADAIDKSGLTQREIAKIANVSTKHLSQVLNFHATVGIDVIERVIDACGRTVKIQTVRTRTPKKAP